MEDSMIDRPSMAFDEKVVGNKRERDGEEEIVLGRLEKRPSGILGVDEEGGGQNINGGIIDTFISNVFHKNQSVTKEECEVLEEDKGDGLGVNESVSNVENGGHEGEEGGGGGIIKDFFSNIFQRNENDDSNGDDQAKNDLGNEVVDKNDELVASDGNFENGGGELKDLNAEKLVEKHDVGSDLPSKDLEAGNKLKMKPDDYSERVFFLNNN